MKRIYIVLTAFSLIVLNACTKDFTEINTNKNVPTQVTPDLLLSGVIRSALNEQVSQAWGTGNLLVQYTAKIQFVNEDRYLWGEKNGIWNNVYGNMRNVQNMIDLASSNSPVQQNYLGVALILKSWLFSLATDSYGDIPYSEAIKAKTKERLRTMKLSAMRLEEDAATTANATSNFLILSFYCLAG